MYTRRELRIYKNGYVDLAKEVVRQWNIDGRPRGDEVGIQLWSDLIDAHMKQQHKHTFKHGASGFSKHEHYTEDH